MIILASIISIPDYRRLSVHCGTCGVRSQEPQAVTACTVQHSAVQVYCDIQAVAPPPAQLSPPVKDCMKIILLY